MKKQNNPFDVQVGGNHYKTMDYQPAEFTMDIFGSFAETMCARYLTRDKGSRMENLSKAYHCIQLEQSYFKSEEVVHKHRDLIEMYEVHVNKFFNQFSNSSAYKAIYNNLLAGNYSKAKENLTKFVRYGRWEEI